MGRIVVIGGAGAMGRIVVRDLVETALPDIDVVVADYDGTAAKKLARSYGRRKVDGLKVDVRDVTGTARALKGAFGVINAVQHQLNLPVMEAAARAGCALHRPRRSVPLHPQAAQARRQVQEEGAAGPARHGRGARHRERPGPLRRRHDGAGARDPHPGGRHRPHRRFPRTPLGTSYSLLTILDEATLPAAVFTEGRFAFVPAMSGGVEVDFPDPVGVRRPAYTIHSEVATLPLSYREKGIREVSFRIAFPDELEAKLRFLNAIGLTSEQPIKVGRQEVVPRDVLLALARRLPQVEGALRPTNTRSCAWWCAASLPASGRGDRRLPLPGDPGLGYGRRRRHRLPPLDRHAAAPPRRDHRRGVLPPERAVPPGPFFDELEKRGMRVERRRVDQAHFVRSAGHSACLRRPSGREMMPATMHDGSGMFGAIAGIAGAVMAHTLSRGASQRSPASAAIQRRSWKTSSRSDSLLSSSHARACLHLNAENGSEVPASKLETILILSALRHTTIIVLHWRFHLRGSSPGSRYSRANGPMAVTWVTYSPDFAQ